MLLWDRMEENSEDFCPNYAKEFGLGGELWVITGFYFALNLMLAFYFITIFLPLSDFNKWQNWNCESFKFFKSVTNLLYADVNRLDHAFYWPWIQQERNIYLFSKNFKVLHRKVYIINIRALSFSNISEI